VTTAPDRQPPRPAASSATARSRSGARAPERPEPKILFQNYFKSVGPRTYAAQVKQAANGNHFLVLTEGKRDAKTGEVKKISLYVYSEDFVEYFRLMKSAADFIKAHPVPEGVRQQRAAYWERQRAARSQAD